MAKTSIIAIVIFFCGLFLVKSLITNNQQRPTSTVKSTIDRKMERIIAQEKRKNDCKLSDKEMKKAVGYFLEQEGITLSSFTDEVLMVNRIVDGLYMVVEDRKRPQYVYNRLEMAKYGISKEMWIGYTKSYKDVEFIDKLKKLIPDNMDKIIDSAAALFGPKLENWLLFKKIIMDFDHKFPQSVNLTPGMKEHQWWAITLGTYKLSPKIYDKILDMITVDYSLSAQEKNIMKEYFEAVKQ